MRYLNSVDLGLYSCWSLAHSSIGKIEKIEKIEKKIEKIEKKNWKKITEDEITEDYIFGE